MIVRRAFQRCLVSVLMALAAGLGGELAWAVQGGTPATPEEGMEVLTRGPVHEAFAGTVASDPEAGLVVRKQPPQTIEELPPDQRPEGDNVTWIPGYWAWDDERSDFLWVSGVWRNLPPGRQWVPGYWGRSDADYQWISGYWADAHVKEIEYLPEPPATVEVGPSTAAPSADQTWVPGSWVWQENRYAWRPGFWAAGQPNWVWTPANYVSTPRGYVFVEGYWDYPVARRGMLYAPVYFPSPTYAQRGFSYSPRTLVNPGAFEDNFFVRPQYQHYYFGDYDGANYRTAGYLRNRLSAPLGQESQRRDSAWHLRAVDQAERERLNQHGREVQRFRDQRQQWEAQAAAEATDPVRRREPVRVKLPNSPIAAKPTLRPDGEDAPPTAHVAPPLDTLVSPQPRPSRSPEQQRRHTTLRPPLDTPEPEVARPVTPVVPPQTQPKVERPEPPRTQPQPRPKPEAEGQVPQSRGRQLTGPSPSRTASDRVTNSGKGKNKPTD